MKYIFLICLSLFLLFPARVHAIYDPLERPNNKYGIHIVDENDLTNAASLVNSSGGDWGYVTLVMTQEERNPDKWKRIFDKMHELHLIPIIRLATKSDGGVWEKPKLEDVLPWADFLEKLPWITQNRYVILFNEPNHAKEWGGTLAPDEYAEIVSSFSATLKSRSSDFFILCAGFDASAPNSRITMDEVFYLQKMLAVKPDFFSYIDGWTSHSYPNPGYVGNSRAKGRGTITNYRWERQILKNLGINKTMPVFITETGWPHQEGSVINKSYYSAEKVADLIKNTAEQTWTDADIVAITPFILNYQSDPFSHFSWQKLEDNSFYPQYETYQKHPKIAGEPIIDSLRITPTSVPINTPTIGPHNNVLGVDIYKNALLAILLKPITMLISRLRI